MELCRQYLLRYVVSEEEPVGVIVAHKMTEEALLEALARLRSAYTRADDEEQVRTDEAYPAASGGKGQAFAPGTNPAPGSEGRTPADWVKLYRERRPRTAPLRSDGVSPDRWPDFVRIVPGQTAMSNTFQFTIDVRCDGKDARAPGERVAPAAPSNRGD